LVDLNDWNYIKYDWKYKEYFPITYEDEKLFINKKIYNKNNEIIYIVGIIQIFNNDIGHKIEIF
jgi:hypothetical protein